MHLRFSQDIKLLLQHLAEKPLTLGDVIAETSERGFSLVIALLILPFLVPTPPGLSTPLGLACLIMSVQMAVGRRTPWLPRKIASFKFPHWFAQTLLRNLQRVTKILEKISRPRFQKFAENELTWRINGLCLTWLAILLMSPYPPATNPIPAVGILLLAVANIESDGVLMWIGYLITVLNTLFFGFAFYILYTGATYLLPNLIP
ncbi:exopolysaccharide biosynthesis protein [Gloeocapsa sp. PCC 73106]|uniref:exopolysaccharide biosynthesis protein n=1 Tax=Gloeocapsa sp. PCC 73106 TaxID=102232 RepID=UPI0002AC3A25|nr:exopolysaccharide biosynthesis protein [Gloeocapsa sp. PCC 73106]ELS00143.1 putative ABC-type transport system, permease component [Gloeocapsa sp. PCC 73106]